MLVVDSDNALGSRFGDIDDAFAVSALLAARVDIGAFTSVFGNTSGDSARRNLQTLGDFFCYLGPILPGAHRAQNLQTPAAKYISRCPAKTVLLALGPLTNVHGALLENSGLVETIEELVIVGANSDSWGRWPPFWPHEFNLTKDKIATTEVLKANLPTTIIPLNVAKRLRMTPAMATMIPTPLREHLQPGIRRWTRRNRLLKGRSDFPIWDLVASMYYLEPNLFRTERRSVNRLSNGYLEFSADSGSRFTIVLDFQPELVWRKFIDLLQKYFE